MANASDVARSNTPRLSIRCEKEELKGRKSMLCHGNEVQIAGGKSEGGLLIASMYL